MNNCERTFDIVADAPLQLLPKTAKAYSAKRFALTLHLHRCEADSYLRDTVRLPVLILTLCKGFTVYKSSYLLSFLEVITLAYIIGIPNEF